MTIPASAILILYSLPTDVKGKKLDEQEDEILIDVERIHAAIGARAHYVSVKSLLDVAATLDDYPFVKVVFNLVEELPGGCTEVNAVPMICRAFGKRCTGSTKPHRDKFLTSRLLAAHSIPVPESTIATRDFMVTDIPAGPVIVKPCGSEGSEGIEASNVAEDDDDREGTIRKAIAKIHAAGQDCIIEQFIDGRELTAGIIVRDGRPHVLPLLETKFEGKGDKPKILSYKAKWAEGSKEHEQTPTVCPAEVSPRLDHFTRELAAKAWYACGCTSYTRTDFRVKGDKPMIIDLNENPDLSVDGGIVQMLKADKIDFADFIKQLVEQAQ